MQSIPALNYLSLFILDAGIIKLDTSNRRCWHYQIVFDTNTNEIKMSKEPSSFKIYNFLASGGWFIL